MQTTKSQYELKQDAEPAADVVVVRPFTEISRYVWRIFIAAWLLFVAIVIFLFGARSELVVTLGVVVMFVAMFLGAPIVLFRISRRRLPQAKSDEHVETYTGRLSQHEALLQIALLPFLLALAMAVIGYLAMHAG